MPSVVAGNTVEEFWTVLDGNSNPLTGMTSPADVTLALLRFSGGAVVAASETVTWTESATVAGRYGIRFTPQNTGVHYLSLKELNASSLQRTTEFRYDIVSAGSVLSPSYANAFCSESDIERWLAQGISASTTPSDTVATAFAQARAGILMSLCNRLGYAVTPSTVTASSRLETLLREANAIGAAFDYTVAQSFGTSPSRTGRAEWLEGLWNQYAGSMNPDGKAVPGIIEMEIRGGLASLSTDHILSGDTNAPADADIVPTSIGIQVSMSDVY